jgi:hypothetical protein
VAELLEPADGETVAIAYLAALAGTDPVLAGVEVAGSLPASSPGYEPGPESIVVRLTGQAPRSRAVDVHQLTLTAWAAGPADELRAAAILRRAAAFMKLAERVGFMAGVPCSDVLAISFYSDPDPITGRARYSGSFGVALRGSAVQ